MITLTTLARRFAGRSSRGTWYVLVHANAADSWSFGGGPIETLAFLTNETGWDGASGFSYPSDWYLVTGRMNAKSIGDVAYSVPMEDDRGGIADINDYTFRVSDIGGFMKSLEDADIYLDGRMAELWWSPDKSVFYWPDDETQFAAGVITRTSHKKGEFEFRVESVERAYTRPCPPNIFDPETISLSDVELANANRGKPIPLPFGSCRLAPGYTITDGATIGGGDYGRVVQFADLGFTADITPAIYGFIGGDTSWGDQGLVHATAGLAKIRNYAGESQYTLNTTTALMYFHDLNPSGLYVEIDVKFTGGPTQMSWFGAWNARGPIDDVTGNYAIVYGAAAIGGGSPTYRGLAYKCPPLSVGGTVTAVQVFYLFTPLWSNNGSEYQYMTVDDQLPSTPYPGTSGCLWGRDTAWTGAADQAATLTLGAAGTNPLTTFSKLGECFITFHNYNWNPATAGTDHYLKTLQLLVRGYTDEWPADGFVAHINGYRDTGNAIAGVSGEPLLSTPAYVTAYILAYLTGAGIANVAVADFRAVAQVPTSNFTIGKSITEQRPVEDHLDGLCRQGGFWVWYDREGKARAFPNAARQTTEPLTILERHMVAEGMLEKWDKTDLQNTVQDFTLRCNLNPVKDDYDCTLYCNPDDSSPDIGTTWEDLCGDSADKYGVRLSKTFECDWIMTRTTGVAHLKRLVEFHTERRWFIEWTSDNAMLNMEMGDVVAIDPEISLRLELPDSLANGEFRISMVRISPANDAVRFRAVQVA